MVTRKFYLKLLMSLLLVAFIAPPAAQAETKTICNGTQTNAFVPVAGFYMDLTGVYSQIIYPEATLDLNEGDIINAITFYTNQSFALGTSFKFYVGKTNKTSITASDVDGNKDIMTEVYSGTLTSQASSDGGYEITITFDNSYEYQGGNLLVGLYKDDNSTSYTSSSFVCYGVSATTGSSYYYCGRSYNGPAAFLPKATIAYEASTTDPIIKVDNDVLNFSALVGSSVTSTVAVTGKNLTGDITATIAGDGFSVNTETLGTTGGELTITYAPTAAGTHTGTLTLSSAGAEDVVITLTGLAEAPTTSGSVTPTNLSFETYAGVSATKTITVENTGNTAFTPTFTIAAPFSIEAATEIAAGASKDFTVTYAPTAVGSNNGTLAVDINGTTTNVTLNGTANEAPKELTVAEDGTATSYHIPITGNYFDNDNDFGQTIYNKNDLGLLANKNITKVKYYSNDAIQAKLAGIELEIYLMETPLDEIEFNGDSFKYIPFEFTGSPNGTYTISGNEGKELEFNLSTPFAYSGNNNLVVQLKVKTKGGYQNIPWVGKAVDKTIGYYAYSTSTTGHEDFLPKTTFSYSDSETPATPVITAFPATLNFETEVGVSRFSEVGVTGENLTEGITATISGENASYFSVTPATLGTEGGTLRVDYDPAAAGNHAATLTLSSAGAEDVVIPINAIATADYAVTVNPENGYNFGNVLVDNTKVWTLTVTNNGTESVTPTLIGLEAPFSTTYTAALLAAGESVSIEISFAPTAVEDYTNAITLSFPEANGAIANYTYNLTGKGVDSFEPTADNEVVKLITVDKRSIYEPNFIDNVNNNTTPQQLNCYDMRFKMAQPDDPAKQIKAGDLHPGNNLYEFYAIDDFGTEFRFATINLFAQGQPSSNPSVSAMDAPIKVTPSVEYYTEEGMPVHPSYSHNTTLKYTEKTYNDINELVDLEGVIDYVNDTWSANTATNSHPDHYKFQIRGVGQYGDLVTSLTSEYVEGHMTGYGNSLVLPEGWERGSWVGPNNEIDGVHSYYYYDLYIKRSFFDERGITGPVTVVVNTTLSGSGFNADNYKAMSVNGVEQIIAKEAFKDYSWTVPLGNDLPENTVVEQVPMGVVIRLVSTGADFNRTTGIYIYGGGTGVSNVDTVNIYKSSMNVKAYTQKQVDEDTDRNLVAMKSADTETSRADVNVLAYGDPAVTGYKLYENSSASTTGITADNHVATATHNETGSYTVNSVSEYDGTYDYVRDESLGNIDGMWLPMYPAESQKYFLPVTVANGIGDDGVVRSEGNTYGSAMQQVEKNGSVAFNKDNSQCIRSEYTWVKDGVRYAIYNPDVFLTSELPAATGYELYNYRLWVDYEDNAPAWDFERDEEGKIHLTTKMDRPLYEGTATHIGGAGAQGRRDEWSFVAPSNLEQIKLVARFYYKKTTGSKARPTDRDRLYYVVENQVTLTVDDAGIVTGIDNVSSKAVANVKYYNMAGIESDVPFQGVNIEVTTYTDGSRTTRKIMK